jgi:hypothetical protein
MFDDENDLAGQKRKYRQTAIPSFPTKSLPLDDTEHGLQENSAQDSVDGPKRVKLSALSGDEISSDDAFSECESDTEHDALEGNEVSTERGCACCDLATSDLMLALDRVADKLAGRASDSRVTSIQLEIFECRVAPLRAEGRDVPSIDRRVLRKHYSQHRISPIRSVAEDIRIFELAERTLRRTGLAEEDEEGVKMLCSRGAAELCKLSKSKLDALKFYVALDKVRKEEEANIKK